jgi:hypothetical protein
MAAPEQPALRLPPFFPRVPKQCKAPAEAFFGCFAPASEYEEGKVRPCG